MTNPPSLSRRLAHSACELTFEALPPAIIEKLRLCFIDALACMFDACEYRHCKQTLASFPDKTQPEALAFIYGVLAHSLVREDMHTASVSHLGVVIFPALLGLAQHKKFSGADFLTAAACAYEAGAGIGRHCINSHITKTQRPTGITGPIAAATALGKALSLNEDQLVSALAVACNTSAGLNQWAEGGTDEMYLHPAFAARNAMTAVRLAEQGMLGSEQIFEGTAGLFAALNTSRESEAIVFFKDKRYEVEQVYFKPAPACNYAQTPCQAALKLVQMNDINISDISRIQVECSSAAIDYPGCDFKGPFATELQAKMSIPFGVASTLFSGKLEASNYHSLSSVELARLISLIELQENPAYSAAYPNKQGAKLVVHLQDGSSCTEAMDDLIPASKQGVEQRFRQAAATRLDAGSCKQLEVLTDNLQSLPDLQDLQKLINQALWEDA